MKVYNIDTGSFDAIKQENLYYIIKKFTELNPLAIKVELASKKKNFNLIKKKDQTNFFLFLQRNHF